MRYYIMFGLTIIISLVIIFYNPKKYLGIYNDNMTIEYNFNEKNFDWNYIVDNDCINIIKLDNEKWKIKPIKDGITNLTFKLINSDDKENVKYEIYYKLKIKNNKIYWLKGNGLGLYDYPNPY